MKPSSLCYILTSFLLLGCLGTQAPAPTVYYGVGQGAGSAGIHTVTQGETLWVISKRYNIAARDIAVVNNLSPPFYLSGGQRLRLPPPQEYKVRGGDSLRDVSRLFGVNASEIASMNNLNPPYALRAGQVLRLPSVTQKSEPQIFASALSPASPAQAMGVAPVDATPLAAPVTATPLAPPSSSIAMRPSTQVLSPPREEAQEQHVQIASANPAPKSLETINTPKRSSGKFLIPVRGRVISTYGPKAGGLYNDGMNIAAPRGAPVKAAENGVVVYAGDELKGSGNLVLIRHADRWMTAYAHMDDIKIKRGQVVKRGQIIGTVGSTGAVDAPQLHFEVRRGSEALNPQPFMEG